MPDPKQEKKSNAFAPDTSIQKEQATPDFSASQPQAEVLTPTSAPEAAPPPVPETPAPTPVEKKHPEKQEPQIKKEEKEGFLDEAIEGLKKTLRRPKKKKPSKIPQVRDEITVQVENIMEEGIKDAFQELTTVQKQEFKIKGEQTAMQIRQLLQATHVKVKKIVRLLIEWLKLLPGVNKFFLEQEAKIKADKIAALKNFFQKKK